MKLRDIFNYMEDTIGWNLIDFKQTYKLHRDYMELYCEDEENPENEHLWCCQFMTDFLRALESLIEKENDDE